MRALGQRFPGWFAVADRIQGRGLGGPPPLFLDQTEARRAENNFWRPGLPLISGSGQFIWSQFKFRINGINCICLFAITFSGPWPSQMSSGISTQRLSSSGSTVSPSSPSFFKFGWDKAVLFGLEVYPLCSSHVQRCLFYRLSIELLFQCFGGLRPIQIIDPSKLQWNPASRPPR